MIKINGIEIPYQKPSLSVEEAIEERSTLSFVMVDKGGLYHFRKGQPVEYHKGGLKFAGVVDTSKEQERSGTVFHTITCADWHYLVDKRIIASAHEGETVGDILLYIIDNYLAEEGITAGNIQEGPIIQEAVFNYVPITDAINALAEKAGYWWKVDQYKQLHFVERATNQGPSISAGDMRKGSVFVEHGNPKYRNRQYIKGGRDITDPQTEIKRGDGEAQTFVVGFPVAKVPTVEVSINGGSWQPQTIGIRQVEEGRQWYWSKGSNVISQDDANTPLNDNDRIRITYQGEFDIIVLSEDMAEISHRQELEGNSGKIEHVEDEPYNTNRNSAFQSANSKLQKYGVIGRKLTFQTQKPIETGQLVKVTFPIHRLDEAEMLVESVTITEESDVVWYNVTCVEGPVSSSWSKMFYAMATRGQAFVIRENISEEQILITLAQFSKTWPESESPNIFKKLRPPFRAGVGTKPTFKYEDRVKYISWFNGETELGRKILTRREGLNTDEINTITFIAPFEANVEITHLGWWGGWKATSQLGTGILIDKQPYEKFKNELEAIQVDKTDIKGW